MTKEDCRVAGIRGERGERWREDADLSLNFKGNSTVDRDLTFSLFHVSSLILLAHILSSQAKSLDSDSYIARARCNQKHMKSPFYSKNKTKQSKTKQTDKQTQEAFSPWSAKHSTCILTGGVLVRSSRLSLSTKPWRRVLPPVTITLPNKPWKKNGKHCTQQIID